MDSRVFEAVPVQELLYKPNPSTCLINTTTFKEIYFAEKAAGRLLSITGDFVRGNTTTFKEKHDGVQKNSRAPFFGLKVKALKKPKLCFSRIRGPSES